MKGKAFTDLEKEIRNVMEDKNIASSVIREFLHQVRQVQAGSTGKVTWDEVGDLRKEDLITYENLSRESQLTQRLSTLAVIKLNGGLGTSMGLDKAKSLIPIRGNDNFLQIIVQQIQVLRNRHNVNIPIFFMNSFRTRSDTLKEKHIDALNCKLGADFPVDFLQNQVPRLYQDTLLPVDASLGEQAWCPPGHGDVFFALKGSGLLDRLLQLGYETIFISNGDNLGAVVDTRILSYFQQEKLDWLSEITYKTTADRKGGILFRRHRQPNSVENLSKEADNIELLEIAQVPEKHKMDFQDLSRFAYFNVNNLWVNLQALNDKLENETLKLALIVNPKQVADKKVLQLETAMGSAISCFSNSQVLLVPRKRFSPVKTCMDLLVRRSDAYYLESESLALVASDNGPDPKVELDTAYRQLSNFEQLVPVIPSLRKAEGLEVSGKICFDMPVKIKGRVSFQVKGNGVVRLSDIGRKIFENERVEL